MSDSVAYSDVTHDFCIVNGTRYMISLRGSDDKVNRLTTLTSVEEREAFFVRHADLTALESSLPTRGTDEWNRRCAAICTDGQRIPLDGVGATYRFRVVDGRTYMILTSRREVMGEFAQLRTTGDDRGLDELFIREADQVREHPRG